MEILSRAPSEFFANSEVWEVRSAIVGDAFRICIAAPEPGPPGGRACGAVYMTDGDWLAGSLVSATRMLALGGELPPLYAVSIAYPIGHERAPVLQRLRDLTPTSSAACDRFTAAMLSSDTLVASGGGDAFLAFLTQELKPALEQTFAIDPCRTTLAGSSLGGLWALTAWLRGTPQIQSYLAISPALWWDGHWLMRQLEERTPVAPLSSSALYLCAGALEREQLAARFQTLGSNERAMLPEDMAQADIARDVLALAAKVEASLPQVRITTQILAGESHNSIVGGGLSHGLRALCQAASGSSRPALVLPRPNH